ncbi:FAD-binding protein [Brevundimonas nasdae]|uniref:FAD-binding protein n=1 Tax=Brevundimonas nasdae TaxID=172043 RepID=A0A0B4CY30_9CAUL|nr:siderophore-interacting protein [Brevundimonas nasdae]KIC59271.1 FAD-binding protein [Brevundimonas nasdae]
MSAREIRRIRHELKFRRLSVVSVEAVTPTLKRVVLGGDDLVGFVSAGFDDHVKIFPVKDGETLHLPTLGPDGPVFPEPRPVSRDYTPRAYDAELNRLTLDFVIGHGGPATEWAEAAAPGSILSVGGPRGSFIVPTDYADHVLIGDETALPAIARRLEELPAGVRALTVIEVKSAASRLAFTTRADLTTIWVERNGDNGQADALVSAAKTAAADVSREDAYVWIATEAQVAKTLRIAMVEMGFDPKAMKAAGYWRLGDMGSHEVIGD